MKRKLSFSHGEASIEFREGAPVEWVEFFSPSGGSCRFEGRAAYDAIKCMEKLVLAMAAMEGRPINLGYVEK